MSTDLVPVQVLSIEEIETIANHAVKSGFYPDLARNPSAATMLALRCQAEGVPAGLAFAQFHVIEGKPAMRADAMHARFLAAGGRIRWVKSDARECAAEFTHPVYGPEGIRITVTIEQMMQRGITGGKDGMKANWRRFPESMLRARVISQGVRAILPGVVCGIYTPEEVADGTTGDVILEARPVASVEAPRPVAIEPPAPAPPAIEAPRPAGPSMVEFRAWCDVKASDYGVDVPRLVGELADGLVAAGRIDTPKNRQPKVLARAVHPAWLEDKTACSMILADAFRPDPDEADAFGDLEEEEDIPDIEPGEPEDVPVVGSAAAGPPVPPPAPPPPPAGKRGALAPRKSAPPADPPVDDVDMMPAARQSSGAAAIAARAQEIRSSEGGNDD